MIRSAVVLENGGLGCGVLSLYFLFFVRSAVLLVLVPGSALHVALLCILIYQI